MTSPLKLFNDLATPDGQADPYPLYAALRQHGPMVDLGGEFMVATTYDAVDRVLRDPAFVVGEGGMFAERSILGSNPPDHTRMRRLMAGVFTARRVNGLREAVVGLSHDLIEAMRAKGNSADIMADFAYRLPVNVICELLGVPEKDRDWFRPVAGDATAVLETEVSPGEMDSAAEASSLLRKYFQHLVTQRRADPQDDLISALALAEPGSISDGELLSNLALLLIAGFETTTNLIGNGLRILFDDPSRMPGLLANPNEFVEEFLRFDPPVQLTSRFAGEAVTVLGQEVPKGTYVLALIGSANRDPLRFRDPDSFDPWRSNNASISFGAGAHFCLGAALARLEAQVAFPLLLQALPGLRPAGDPVRRQRLVLRGYESMPVAWDAPRGLL